jgi:hypothetical protein
MPATPKSLRAAPPRRFENYTLTRVTSPAAGLTGIKSSAFTQVPGPAGTGGSSFAIQTTAIPIGFDFQFDGITYKKFIPSTSGFLMFEDPANTGQSYIGDFDGNHVALNGNIKVTSSFSFNQPLLAPWFDDLRNNAQLISQLPSNGASHATDQQAVRVKFGLETPLASVNEVAYGVSYYNDNSNPKGRRLIVRWTSFSNYGTNAYALIMFEAVLYENGSIEFRYAPKKPVNDLAIAKAHAEGATCGIFMPGALNRFRDFSTELNYRVGERTPYIYGGAVYSSTYTDSDTNGDQSSQYGTSTTTYTVGLTTWNNWPGQNDNGCILHFDPPKNRRQVLPRARQDNVGGTFPIVRRTSSDYRLGNFGSSFDDRKSLAFTTGVIVNYPTTLSRFYGAEGGGTRERQDLFAGDFLVTGSYVKSALDSFTPSNEPQYSNPFNENQRFEQGATGSSAGFYATGSGLRDVGPGFTSMLSSKTQVRISLPIDYSVMMLPSSSIYYYNYASHAWNVPQNSTYTIVRDGSSTTVPTNNQIGDIANPSVDATAARIIEDARGFGAIGNVVASGTLTPSGLNQTNANIGATYSPGSVTIAVTDAYGNSIQTNPQYSANVNEVFSLPISQPFLIEKAVIEVPIAMGDGWFKDMTEAAFPLGQVAGAQNFTGFDLGGPAITVSLFNQLKVGNKTRRDLILTGTITHKFDNDSNTTISNFVNLAPSAFSSSQMVIRPRGFLGYTSPPAAVVTPASSSLVGFNFTGSAVLPCKAMTTHGVVLSYLLRYETGNNRQGVVDFLY